MQRSEMINRLKQGSNYFDVIVIGGGANGLGTAVDALSRGFKTLLIERNDFAQGTSSRSSKLIHGGLRYLKQGQFNFVWEALKERAILFKNAPHLVHPLPFLIPTQNFFEQGYYWFGLKTYDMLAGSHWKSSSHSMSKENALKHIPELNPKLLNGAVTFFDGQFEDARLAITLAQTVADLGGIALNYMPFKSFIKKNGQIIGIIAHDAENNSDYELHAKIVINATGAFSDEVQQLDNPQHDTSLAMSLGTHLVIDRKFYSGDHALLIPQTEDKRILFVIPWLSKVLIGTTDVKIEKAEIEPIPSQNEVEYLLRHVSKWLVQTPQPEEILSLFSGIRPLVKPSKESAFSSIPREHAIFVSAAQLISIIGGKWTTYRKTGEETINKAIEVAHLPYIASKTAELKLHGYTENSTSFYGSDEPLVKKIGANFLIPFDSSLPYRPADVIWAVRNEMAVKLEDVLARRTRLLFLDVKKALEIAPIAAKLMSHELSKDSAWEREQLDAFSSLAKGYDIHNFNNAVQYM